MHNLDRGIAPYFIAALMNGSMFAIAIIMSNSGRLPMIIAGALGVILVGPAILGLPFAATIYTLLTVVVSLLLGTWRRRQTKR